MRTSITVCLLGMAGALTGGWLVGRWCLGLVLITVSGLAVYWAVFLFDDGQAAAPRALSPGRTLTQVLERARRAPD